MIRRSRIALCCCVSASLALAACDAGDDVNTALQRMMVQPRANTYGENELFKDHRAMRPLPEGVVSRDVDLAAEQATDDFPAPITRDQLRRGRERFAIYCAPCHGFLGDGNSVVAMNMELRAPPSLTDPKIKAFTPGRLFRIVSEGYGLMPSYRLQLSAADRWAVVAFVRALQMRDAVPISSLPASLQAEARQALP